MKQKNISHKTSQFYDEHWAKYPLELQGALEHLLRLFPEGVTGKKVLDAGCGSGIVSIVFGMLGADVLGVDDSRKCVFLSSQRAREMGISVKFEQHDLTTLDLKGRGFDIIYSWGVLHHTLDAEGSFDRLAGHLEQDGRIVVAVYLKTWLSGFWNLSRVFYQKSPEAVKGVIRFSLAAALNWFDIFNKTFLGKQPPMMRGTRNEELVNDWFGVPQRTFHSYEEVFGWFQKNGLSYQLTSAATGRFRSTSNFEVMGWETGN